MRFLNVLSALVVLGCAVWLSLHHTHALFMGVGFNSRDAWVATLLSETLFLTGGLNLANSRLRGYTPSVPAYLGFIQGVLLVGASNIVATWEYGLDGWLLGGSIVTAVLISEAIMTAETKKKKKADENAEQEPEEKDATATATAATAENAKPTDNDTVKDSADDATNNTATTDSADTAAEHKRTTAATATGYAATKTAEEEDNAANTTTDDAEQSTTTANDTADDSTTKTEEVNADNSAADRVVNMAELKQKRKRELDHETVKEIFLAEGSNSAIARQFGVNAETVRRIKLGIRHAEITAPLRSAK